MKAAISIALIAGLLAQGTPAPAPSPAPTVPAAQALIATGDNAGARAMLEKVVKREPRNFRAWSVLGNACGRLNDNDCAAAAFDKALGIRPDDPQTLVNLGVTHAAKGDVEAAFARLGKARATRRVDMTQLTGNAAVAPLLKDPRYAALMPVAADFENPFVESTNSGMPVESATNGRSPSCSIQHARLGKTTQ